VAGGRSAGAGVLVWRVLVVLETDDFQRRVGKEIVSVLENATGGRVELAHVHFACGTWRWKRMAVIHGLEGPAKRLIFRDKCWCGQRFSASSRIAQVPAGVARGIGSAAGRAPQMHLIVDKTADQPAGAQASAQSTEPIQDTLLDLRANEAIW